MDFAGLSPHTSRQYAQTWKWFIRQYGENSDLTHTQPIQNFIDLQLTTRDQRCRVIQCIINKHMSPRPIGPPITLPGLRKSQTENTKSGSHSDRGKNDDDSGRENTWISYMPRFIQPHVKRSSFWTRTFTEYIAVLGGNRLRQSMVRSYVAHTWRVFRDILKFEDAIEPFLTLSRGMLVSAVLRAYPDRVHQRRMCCIAVNHLLGRVIFRDHPIIFEQLALKFTRHLFGRRKDRDAYQENMGRDHFITSEIKQILQSPGLGMRDRLILLIMSETGLRRRAIAWLMVNEVYDVQKAQPLLVCRACEKGMVTRSFILSQSTRDLLAEYIRQGYHHGSKWLFPSPRNHHCCLSPLSIHCMLLRVSKAAGISGRHVHCHGIRKYVVCELMAAKNRIEITGTHLHTHTRAYA